MILSSFFRVNSLGNKYFCFVFLQSLNLFPTPLQDGSGGQDLMEGELLHPVGEVDGRVPKMFHRGS